MNSKQDELFKFINTVTVRYEKNVSKLKGDVSDNRLTKEEKEFCATDAINHAFLKHPVEVILGQHPELLTAWIEKSDPRYGAGLTARNILLQVCERVAHKAIQELEFGKGAERE